MKHRHSWEKPSREKNTHFWECTVETARLSCDKKAVVVCGHLDDEGFLHCGEARCRKHAPKPKKKGTKRGK
jgi:hypothetical protein